VQVSVIIPTYNRVKDLDECLDSIIIQTTLPKEIIMVDDSDDDEITNLVDYRRNEFKAKDVFMNYIRNEKEKSLTIARNSGIENAAGDIILFLDSDVILDKDYIKEILKIYKENFEAMGVQGFICNIKKGMKVRHVFNRLFYLGFNEKNGCRVLSSFYSTYPPSVDRVISCEWLSGANHSFRRDVLEEFKYDENLKKYSSGEDVDISYRIFKRYPDSLFMAPYARLIHKVSQEARLPKKELVYMDEIYNLYLFHKNIDQNLKNRVIYLWSRIGKMIYSMILLFLQPSRSKLTKIKYLIGAYIYCINHVNEIEDGNLEFFNKRLR
jgi:glycosyltransferase involved in cell wall biosynthesis